MNYKAKCPDCESEDYTSIGAPKTWPDGSCKIELRRCNNCYTKCRVKIYNNGLEENF